MSLDEAALEAEIQAKGKTAPRITPADIDAAIAAENWFNAAEAAEALGQPATKAMRCLTICVLTLKNGFTLVGENACASPGTYDAEIGRKLARDNARNQIWRLEGYRLRSMLAAME
jgi:hypothetical protein